MEKRQETDFLMSQLSFISGNPDELEILREKLIIQFNDLIDKDFEYLVYLLYRIDIDENKMRKVLNENPGNNAGELIADMVIERQLQKIETRKQFKQEKNENDTEERW